jgi:hypothetical protein
MAAERRGGQAERAGRPDEPSRIRAEAVGAKDSQARKICDAIVTMNSGSAIPMIA